MKKTILSVALAAASLTALAGGSTPVAQSSFSPFYAGVNGGANILSGKDVIHFNTGWNVGGFLGYRFNENIRADLSLDYIRNAYSKDYKPSVYFYQYATLVNVYYDITQLSIAGLVPYVGAGLGWVYSSSNEVDTFHYNGIGWQLATGMNYNVAPNMSLGLGYRFLANHSTYNGGANTADNNLINASLTYHFSM